MKLETFEKRPADKKDYDIGYSSWLSTGDAIDTATATVTCDDETTPALQVDSIATNTNTVKLWISGGTIGKEYKVTVTATTTNVPPRIDQTYLIFKVK